MANINRRRALALLTAGSPAAFVTGSVAVAPPVADAMAVMCEARRRYIAAYATAPFVDRDGEEEWCAANDPDPDNVLGLNPPPITSDAGLRAAIEFIAVTDKDFTQNDHVRILTRALEYLDGRA